MGIVEFNVENIIKITVAKIKLLQHVHTSDAPIAKTQINLYTFPFLKLFKLCNSKLQYATSRPIKQVPSCHTKMLIALCPVV